MRYRITASLLTATFALLALTLSGCATNPVTGQSNFVLMSEDQEIETGRKLHQEILKQYAVYDNAAVQAYVTRLGEELGEASHRSNLVYHFTVLDDPMVNAFALPGGYIYITRGIMAYMNTESQLAGVLGHELGHVTARHSVRQQSQAMVTGILASIAVAGTGSQAVSDLANVAGNAVITGYGRKHELEADRLGAEYLARLGYDPDEMIEVIDILKSQEQFEVQRAREEGRQPQSYHGLFATHPANDRRLQEVIETAKQYQAGKPRTVDDDAFKRLLDGMTFGDNADQGVTRGNRFYHQGLDLFIEFPPGWRIDNRPDALVATPQSNDAVIQFTLRDMNRKQPPEQFLLSQFKPIDDGESLQINGEPGFTGIAKLDTAWGSKDSRVAALYHGKDILIAVGAHRRGLLGDDYFDTLRSIRELGPDESALAQSRRIKVIRAQPGDDFARLAAESPLTNYAEDRLRLLNGMFPAGEPEPGQLVKIIE